MIGGVENNQSPLDVSGDAGYVESSWIQGQFGDLDAVVTEELSRLFSYSFGNPIPDTASNREQILSLIEKTEVLTTMDIKSPLLAEQLQWAQAKNYTTEPGLFVEPSPVFDANGRVQHLINILEQFTSSATSTTSSLSTNEKNFFAKFFAIPLDGTTPDTTQASLLLALLKEFDFDAVVSGQSNASIQELINYQVKKLLSDSELVAYQQAVQDLGLLSPTASSVPHTLPTELHTAIGALVAKKANSLTDVNGLAGLFELQNLVRTIDTSLAAAVSLIKDNFMQVDGASVDNIVQLDAEIAALPKILAQYLLGQNTMQGAIDGLTIRENNQYSDQDFLRIFTSPLLSHSERLILQKIAITVPVLQQLEAFEFSPSLPYANISDVKELAKFRIDQMLSEYKMRKYSEAIGKENQALSASTQYYLRQLTDIDRIDESEILQFTNQFGFLLQDIDQMLASTVHNINEKILDQNNTLSTSEVASLHNKRDGIEGLLTKFLRNFISESSQSLTTQIVPDDPLVLIQNLRYALDAKVGLLSSVEGINLFSLLNDEKYTVKEQSFIEMYTSRLNLDPSGLNEIQTLALQREDVLIAIHQLENSFPGKKANLNNMYYRQNTYTLIRDDPSILEYYNTVIIPDTIEQIKGWKEIVDASTDPAERESALHWMRINEGNLKALQEFVNFDFEEKVEEITQQIIAAENELEDEELVQLPAMLQNLQSIEGRYNLLLQNPKYVELNKIAGLLANYHFDFSALNLDKINSPSDLALAYVHNKLDFSTLPYATKQEVLRLTELELATPEVALLKFDLLLKRLETLQAEHAVQTVELKVNADNTLNEETGTPRNFLYTTNFAPFIATYLQGAVSLNDALYGNNSPKQPSLDQGIDGKYARLAVAFDATQKAAVIDGVTVGRLDPSSSPDDPVYIGFNFSRSDDVLLTSVVERQFSLSGENLVKALRDVKAGLQVTSGTSVVRVSLSNHEIISLLGAYSNFTYWSQVSGAITTLVNDLVTTAKERWKEGHKNDYSTEADLNKAVADYFDGNAENSIISYADRTRRNLINFIDNGGTPGQFKSGIEALVANLKADAQSNEYYDTSARVVFVQREQIARYNRDPQELNRTDGTAFKDLYGPYVERAYHAAVSQALNHYQVSSFDDLPNTVKAELAKINSTPDVNLVNNTIKTDIEELIAQTLAIYGVGELDKLPEDIAKSLQALLDELGDLSSPDLLEKIGALLDQAITSSFLNAETDASDIPSIPANEAEELREKRGEYRDRLYTLQEKLEAVGASPIEKQLQVWVKTLGRTPDDFIEEFIGAIKDPSLTVDQYLAQSQRIVNTTSTSMLYNREGNLEFQKLTPTIYYFRGEYLQNLRNVQTVELQNQRDQLTEINKNLETARALQGRATSRGTDGAAKFSELGEEGTELRQFLVRLKIDYPGTPGDANLSSDNWNIIVNQLDSRSRTANDDANQISQILEQTIRQYNTNFEGLSDFVRQFYQVLSSFLGN